MYQSEQINELATALAKAQGQMQHAIKDSINPHFKSKYADLASVIDAIRIPLSENGLSFVQPVRIENGVNILDTILFHTSGQWIKSSVAVNVDGVNRNAIQAFGSTLSYLRRYSLSSLIGVSQDDDDGNSATQATVTNRVQAPEKVVQYINEAQIKWIEEGFESLGEDVQKKVMERLKGCGCVELSKIKLEWYRPLQDFIAQLAIDQEASNE